ncbi:MAG: response regulator [Planctomycetota bacterium]|jgi:DNA-binding NarL/FixJ family response regulator
MVKYTGEQITEILSKYKHMIKQDNFLYAVVDPSIPGRKTAVKALQDLDLKNISEYKDASLALAELANSERPVFLITDISECKLIKVLKSKEKLYKALLVTSETRKPQLQAALSTGVNAYLPKPLTAEALSEKIKEFEEEGE